MKRRGGLLLLSALVAMGCGRTALSGAVARGRVIVDGGSAAGRLPGCAVVATGPGLAVCQVPAGRGDAGTR